MCGRYSLDKPKQLRSRFDTENDVDVLAKYDIRPSQELPVIINKEHTTIELMRWGLIPFWAKEAKIGYKMINARAETVATLASYKKPFRSQRCLVPASGFYEWKAVGKEKKRYYFHRKDDELFAFAGLYDTWRDPQGKEIQTYTIITTTPNTTVGTVHDRMPVMLAKEQEKLWLDPDITEPERLLSLLHPYSDAEMEGYPVSSVIESAEHIKPPPNSA